MKFSWASICAGLTAVSSLAGASFTTIYINQYYEVREGDAPVKYIWNAQTRIARASGVLGTTQRVQRLRLFPGWNLCTVAVAAAKLPNRDGIRALYRWDPKSRNWTTPPDDATLDRGAVLWIKASKETTIALAGDHQEASAEELALHQYHGVATFEPVPLAGLVANVALSRFDASRQSWITMIPFLENLEHAESVPPGSAFFLGAGAPSQLQPAPARLRLRYYHCDHLDSATAVTDNEGTLVEETTFYPYGALRHEFLQKATAEEYKFTQKEKDRESGQHYFEARYLNGIIPRFVSADPRNAAPDAFPTKDLAIFLASPQAAHLYSYARCNPVRYVDPTGLDISTPTSSYPHRTSGEDIVVTLKNGTEVTVSEDNVVGAYAVHDSWKRHYQRAVDPGRGFTSTYAWSEFSSRDPDYVKKKLERTPQYHTSLFLSPSASVDSQGRITHLELTPRIITGFATQEAMRDPSNRFAAGVRGAEILNYMNKHPLPKLKKNSTFESYSADLRNYVDQMSRTIEILNGYQPPAD